MKSAPKTILRVGSDDRTSTRFRLTGSQITNLDANAASGEKSQAKNGNCNWNFAIAGERCADNEIANL